MKDILIIPVTSDDLTPDEPVDDGLVHLESLTVPAHTRCGRLSFDVTIYGGGYCTRLCPVCKELSEADQHLEKLRR